MIKRNILIIIVSLFVIALIYFFPNGSDEYIYEQNIAYQTPQKTPIYLKDINDYVSRTDIINTDQNIDDKIVNIIKSLTINSDKKDYIPSGFYPLIPENTTLISHDLDNGLLKLNFSEDFINTSDGEKMIESLVYTLTEINDIERIMIFVNNNILLRIPNTNKKLPIYLDRSFGINKIFNINSLDNVSLTTTYYLGKYKDKEYYIPISVLDNNSNNKIEVVINNLKSNPINNTNLFSYMVNSVELLDFESNEETAILNFNSNILNDLTENNIEEEVKYTIFLSLRDNLGIKSVIFYVNNEEIDELSIEK